MTPEQIAELKHKHKEILVLESGQAELIKSINDLKASFISGRDSIISIDTFSPNRASVYLGRADRETLIVRMLLNQLEDELTYVNKRIADL